MATDNTLERDPSNATYDETEISYGPLLNPALPGQEREEWERGVIRHLEQRQDAMWRNLLMQTASFNGYQAFCTAMNTDAWIRSEWYNMTHNMRVFAKNQSANHWRAAWYWYHQFQSAAPSIGSFSYPPQISNL